jgi:hypothetical protein
MTAHHDLDEQLTSFLRDGPTELPYQSFDAVRERTEQTGQRVVVGPWRLPEMNKIVTIGLGAAAVVVALFVGAQLMGLPVGGLGNAPTPSPTLESTPEPTPSASAADSETSLVIANGQADDPQDAYPPLTVTVPAGWGIEDPTGVLVEDSADPPDGAFMMVFAEREYWVYGDPCQWSATKPDRPSTTVDELVAALTAQASRDASEPVDITVDGYAGKSLTLHVPDDAVFEDCDNGNFGYWASIDLEFGDDGSSPSRHAQAPGQIDTLYILDLDGVIMIIDASYYAETPAEDIAALEAIVESATFGN